jgi:hypothetical protein
MALGHLHSRRTCPDQHKGEELHQRDKGDHKCDWEAGLATLVLEAFDTLFNTRDYAAAERFWPPKYIQHSAHIAPGREGLFAQARSSPETLRYENQLIVAEGDMLMLHGRFSGLGLPANWIWSILFASRTDC